MRPSKIFWLPPKKQEASQYVAKKTAACLVFSWWVHRQSVYLRLWLCRIISQRHALPLDLIEALLAEMIPAKTHIQHFTCSGAVKRSSLCLFSMEYKNVFSVRQLSDVTAQNNTCVSHLITERGNPWTPVESVNGLRCRSLVLSVSPCSITTAAVLLRSQSGQFKCGKEGCSYTVHTAGGARERSTSICWLSTERKRQWWATLFMAEALYFHLAYQRGGSSTEFMHSLYAC